MFNISRRSFLGGIFKGITAVAGAGSLPPSLFSKAWKSLTGYFERRKLERTIAKALNSTAGREALVMSMVEPIRRSLEYQAIGRKLFMVDDLPQGALARYSDQLSQHLSA
jgi:hypothetical protein